jgi:ATP-dependent helicase/nuclease subunit A
MSKRKPSGSPDQILLFDAEREKHREKEEKERESSGAGRIELERERERELETKTTALPDQAARDRIRTDLDTNLLVEAGAGAGKTTEMVSRMVALVESGRARIDQVAAVTFTRKAAGELRERFQEELERRALLANQRDEDPEKDARLSRAVAELDRAFIGTIHAFCARILREHSIDAGLDPAFVEMQAPEEAQQRRAAWTRYLELLAQTNDSLLQRLSDVGVRPAQLYSLYELLSENPDVLFPTQEVPRPDPGAVRERLRTLHDRGLGILPSSEPREGWDSLQKCVRELRYWRDIARWEDDVVFFGALAHVIGASVRVAKKSWTAHEKDAADDLSAELEDFRRTDGQPHALLLQWYAHRYPIALELARSAAQAYDAERRRNGTLSFQDLLLLSAELLEKSAHARRALGERFRYLLVDEFQDTDPIQARVLMLLTAEDYEQTDWRRATPRPGSLFVVGDPKQSIYRFRRADITTYNQVKARFREFGDVVELNANFRSRKPIERFVNNVFVHHFPTEATAYQAAFSELRVQKEDAAHQGVFWYRLQAAGQGGIVVQAAREDSERIASWIRTRIDAGERTPGSFMILTRAKKFIDMYARALEARSIPVQASGAAVGIEDELSELVLLLNSLADPGDASLVLAVITGLFFGIDFEAIAQYLVDEKRTLEFHVDEDIAHPCTAEGAESVRGALVKLHEWWQLTRRLPADVAVPRIVDELGLLAYAAAGDLGETRAGSLLFALDAIRAAALAGDASLVAAINALESIANEDEAEAPLEPGRSDVVRVMNVHKAKGLEADVVILGDPRGNVERDVTRHIDRSEDEQAIGFVVVEDAAARKNRYEKIIAQPLDWEEHAREEKLYDAAEDDRLLYVAATRAREELVVSHWIYNNSPSPWKPFYGELRTNFEEIGAPIVRAPAREQLTRSAESVVHETLQVDSARAAAAQEGYRIASVTKRVKQGDAARLFERYGEGRGTRWGSAVHGALEAAGNGLTGEALRTACRGLLIDNECPVGPGGEPEWLEDLVATVTTMLSSAVWQRAQASSTALHECPFLVRWSGNALPDGTTPESEQVIEGIIDLIFRETDGWVIVDYKTDTITDPDVRRGREELYRKQLDLYSACWEQMTGEKVKERVLVYTGDWPAVVW